MFYFIPTWYNDYRFFYDNTQPFYIPQKNMEFDDTIHQIRLFKNANEQATTVVLNYSPNLRRFFERQNIVNIPYISVFDIIQNVEGVQTKTIGLYDLSWDDNSEFIYTPFLVSVFKNGKKYANVNFTLEGNIYFIDFFEDNVYTKKFIFDDRGFLSSVIFCEYGREICQEYLDTTGVWQVREYLNGNNIVEVNDVVKHRFKKQKYNNIRELIEEKIQEIFSNCHNDSIVISSSNVHNDLLLSVIQNNNIIFSLNKDKLKSLNEESINYYYNVAKMIVVDSKETEEQLLNIVKEDSNKKIKQIPLYDTRLELGKSQRKEELIIYLFIDGHTEKELKEILINIIDIMKEDELVQLIIGTYGKVFEVKKLQRLIDNILEEEFNNKLIVKWNDKQFSENNLDILSKEKVTELNIKITTTYNELNLIKTLEYVRLIIDLGKHPDMMTTILGISSGIPQINKVKNNYVENYKNGIIINNYDELKDVINYYFSGLENWNKSLVYSVQQILKYTGPELVEMWKKQLEE